MMVDLEEEEDWALQDEVENEDEERYRKVPKFLDVRYLYCNLPKIQTKRPNLKGILSKWCKWNSKH